MPNTAAHQEPTELAEIKARLTAARQQLGDAHARGATAHEVGSALSDLTDRVIEQTYRQALSATGAAQRSPIAQQLTLIALGGYGRRDLAPYSDVDLLFLTRHEATAEAREFVSRMVRDLWDVGLQLSHSVRTLADCSAAGRQDLTIRTALAEARLVLGHANDFHELQRQVQRLFRATSINTLIAQIETERTAEHQDYQAQTVLLLEPNLKKSPGGLRDYHMFRWLLLARHGIREVEIARTNRILSADDADAIIEGRDFLQQLRNEMHFFAGSAQDVLTREEQLRLAKHLGFPDDAAVLGVERFMQHYYRRTTALHDAVCRFIDSLRSPPLVSRILHRVWSEWVDEHFLLTRTELRINPADRDAVLNSAECMLRLFDISRERNVPVAHESMEQVRAACPGLKVNARDRRAFLKILAQPVGLGRLVRNLHRVGLLSKILPPFEHAHCLIQFNLMHKYTVDEHSLRVLEAAVQRLPDDGPIGQAYREIRRKDLLHLAMLLHDLGKGLGGDHCIVGRQLAEQTAREFELNPHETQVLCDLVEHHLAMANTAFRRDLSEATALVQFAREVATPEMLRMLYVHTACDTAAVSPENWTAWKQALLDELYLRTAEVLTGDVPVGSEQTRIGKIRGQLSRSLHGRFPAEWLTQQLELMPLAYLQTTSPSTVTSHLEALSQMSAALEMPAAPVRVESQYLTDTQLVEYTVLTRDDVAEGLFSRIAGALAAAGVQIVGARIFTRSDGVVIDTFTGQDLTCPGEPPAIRRDEVAEQITDVLLGRRNLEKMLARRSPFSSSPASLVHTPPQVEIDNESSDHFTIVEVFAEDRLGRLYAITRTLFEHGLSIHSARISTQADQIVDVFYVTDRAGRKVDADTLERIREDLLGRLTRDGGKL